MNQIQDLLFDREQVDILLPVSTVTVVAQISISCQEKDIYQHCTCQVERSERLHPTNLEPSPITSQNVRNMDF